MEDEREPDALPNPNAGQVFFGYNNSFPGAALAALSDVALNRSNLDFASKVNAGYAVLSFGMGQAFPVNPNVTLTAAPIRGTQMRREHLGAQLRDLANGGEHMGVGHVGVGAVNWGQIVMDVIRLIQDLLAAGA